MGTGNVFVVAQHQLGLETSDHLTVLITELQSYCWQVNKPRWKNRPTVSEGLTLGIILQRQGAV